MSDISLPPGTPPAHSGTKATLSGLTDARILVVDDVPENRNLLVRRLTRMGITDVTEASDGNEALNLLQCSRFDLVLLDIMMPGMNGFEVLERLNTDGRIHSLAVIVISALGEMEDIVRCIEQGAEDYLLKPFDRTLLRARILSSLEKKLLRDRTRMELERKQAELAEARTLQLALAPPGGTRQTASGALVIDLVLDPAKEVGGDLADHFPVGENLHVFMVGDVSDKGAGSALMMARTCALFRGLAARPDADALFADPAAAVSEANRVLAANNPSSMFVTLWLGALDLAEGRLRHVRAGHVPPLLRRATGKVERFDELGGLPLGVIEDEDYTAAEFDLRPGDALLVFTDGVSESVSPDGVMLGEEGAAAWLAAEGACPPAVADLVAAVRAHEGGLPPSDDLAAIIVRLEQDEKGADVEEHLLALQVIPTPAEISAMLDQVAEFLERSGVDQRPAHHVGLVLDELLTNVAAHGGIEYLPCDIRVAVEPSLVRLTIEDQAEPFDPRQAPDPDIGTDVGDRPIGGLGLFLVRSLAGEVDYRREGDRNVTSLWIGRASSAPSSGEE